MGELAALGAALTFAVTSIIEKSLTRRLTPPSLAALGSLGGALLMLVLMFATGRTRDIPGAPLDSMFMSISGGVLSIAVGYSLYLWFLRSVDVSKAAPLGQGLFALFGVLAGLLFLGESLSNLTLVGSAAIISGIYMLSISQRRQIASREAKWLGFKGLVFLMFVAILWVIGWSLQKEALKDLDVLIANGIRLPVVTFFLMTFASAGLGRSLVGRSMTTYGKALGPVRAVAETVEARPAPRHRSESSRPSSVKKGFAPAAWFTSRGMRQVSLYIHPPVTQARIEELAQQLGRIDVTLHPDSGHHRADGMCLKLKLPRGLDPEAILAAMPAVAYARKIGRRPRSGRIELGLRTRSSVGEGTPDGSAGPAEAFGPTVREVSFETASLRSWVVPVANGSVSFGIGSLLLLIALDKTGLAITMVLNSTGLLFIAVFSVAFLRERLSLKTITGVVVTVLGVLLVLL